MVKLSLFKIVWILKFFSTRKSHLTSPSIYRKAKRRALYKNGECNIILENVSKLRRRYLQDLFTTLVDARWRWTLCVFVMSFLLSWLAFGIIWYLIAFTHGDLSPENIDNPLWLPCVINMKTFMASFLFSVETQHTTGFGYRMVTEECHEAIVFFCFQSIVGLMIQVRWLNDSYTVLNHYDFDYIINEFLGTWCYCYFLSSSFEF